MLRFIHTADWHLGARLIDCDRHAEHRAFLDWLLARLIELKPDLLIVAGDIFDSTTPPQEALQLYYQFLARLAAQARCRTLILGGNHDSPATLHAPRELLAALDVLVLATPPADPADALLVFPEAVVCAVPFLRERDLRNAAPGQSPDVVAAAIRTGVTACYRAAHDAARTLGGNRLLVGTGHLTAVGSQLSPSERSIHIGNLGAIDSSCFDGFAYTALGHIHRAQSVESHDHVRYCGSPIPLSFAEIDVPKELRVIEIDTGIAPPAATETTTALGAVAPDPTLPASTLPSPTLRHRALPIPVFRPLLRLTCAAADLASTLTAHQGPPAAPFPPWIELTVTDGRSHPDLDRLVREAAHGLNLRILKLLTPALAPDPTRAETSAEPAPSLDQFTPEQVFLAKLREAAIDPASDTGKDLVLTFDHLLSRMQETPEAPPSKELGARSEKLEVRTSAPPVLPHPSPSLLHHTSDISHHTSDIFHLTSPISHHTSHIIHAAGSEDAAP